MKRFAFAALFAGAVLAPTLPLGAQDTKLQPAGQVQAVNPAVAKLKAASKTTAQNRAGQCGMTIDFEGTLADAAGNPLAGKTLVFDAPGLFHDSKQTDAQGRATRPFAVGDSRKADTYPFTVAFAGDSTHLPSKTSASCLLVRAKTKIVIGNVELVYNEGSNPGPGVPVVAIHLERDADSKKIPGNVKVSINGVLVNTVSEPLTNIMPPGNGPWKFECAFEAINNDSYDPTTATRTLHR